MGSTWLDWQGRIFDCREFLDSGGESAFVYAQERGTSMLLGMGDFEDEVRRAADRRQQEERQQLTEQARLNSVVTAQEARLDLLRNAAVVLSRELAKRNVEHDRVFERLRERAGRFGRSKWVAEWTASGWTLTWKQTQAHETPARRDEVMLSEAGDLVYFWGPVAVTVLSPTVGKLLHAVAGSFDSQVDLLTISDLVVLDGLPRPNISLDDIERALADKAVEYQLDPDLFRR